MTSWILYISWWSCAARSPDKLQEAVDNTVVGRARVMTVEQLAYTVLNEPKGVRPVRAFAQHLTVS